MPLLKSTFISATVQHPARFASSRDFNGSLCSPARRRLSAFPWVRTNFNSGVRRRRSGQLSLRSSTSGRAKILRPVFTRTSESHSNHHPPRCGHDFSPDARPEPFDLRLITLDGQTARTSGLRAFAGRLKRRQSHRSPARPAAIGPWGPPVDSRRGVSDMADVHSRFEREAFSGSATIGLSKHLVESRIASEASSIDSFCKSAVICSPKFFEETSES